MRAQKILVLFVFLCLTTLTDLAEGRERKALNLMYYDGYNNRGYGYNTGYGYNSGYVDNYGYGYNGGYAPPAYYYPAAQANPYTPHPQPHSYYPPQPGPGAAPSGAASALPARGPKTCIFTRV
mgnify:CR=1 FL=1